jgi:hypothetical protein
VGPVIVGTNNLAGLGQYMRNTGNQGASFYIGFRSKIGDCSKAIVYDDSREWAVDSAAADSAILVEEDRIQNDTIFMRDTIIKRDTIVKTEIKTIVKRDTVIVTKTVNTNNNNFLYQNKLQHYPQTLPRLADAFERIGTYHERNSIQSLII